MTSLGTTPRNGQCWTCQKDLDHLSYGRGDICPGCRRDTRVCKNCTHFSAGYQNDCRESQADRVVDKERSNFCDYFVPSNPLMTGGSTGSGNTSRDSLKAAAEALFKKK